MIRMKYFVFVTGMLFLIALEFFRVYFIMPFPGSQKKDTLELAYWIHSNIGWLRVVSWLLVAGSLFFIFRTRSRKSEILCGIALVVYGIVFYMFNFKMLAEKMFYQPETKLFADKASNQIDPRKLVLGVQINGEAKAYPIQIIGYHHQVRDTVGGTPIMVTYCTVCRTGRVFSPEVNGESEIFRLVGMDHFNAMFEDSRTGSWWRQVNGEAVAGPLKGQYLRELPAQQRSLDAWLRDNPHGLVMQYDPAFIKEYEDLDLFDDGTIDSGLERRDTASWQFKSWVVGISVNGQARAYDWNALLREKFIQDSMPGGNSLMLILEKDSLGFHAFNRMIGTQSLQFEWLEQEQQLRDELTGSVWDLSGKCVDGTLKGTELERLQAYQEFWHSWQSFHTNTDRYPKSD